GLGRTLQPPAGGLLLAKPTQVGLALRSCEFTRPLARSSLRVWALPRIGGAPPDSPAASSPAVCLRVHTGSRTAVTFRPSPCPRRRRPSLLQAASQARWGRRVGGAACRRSRRPFPHRPTPRRSLPVPAPGNGTSRPAAPAGTPPYPPLA